jgi:hypothetical protein
MLFYKCLFEIAQNQSAQLLIILSAQFQTVKVRSFQQN